MNWVCAAITVLSAMGYSVYSRMPSFGKGGQPELFMVVTGYDSAAARSDGRLMARRFYITVALFADDQSALDAALEAVIPALEAMGIRYSGCRYSEDEDFPQRYRRDAEFVSISN